MCGEAYSLTAAVPGPDGWEMGQYGIRTPILSRSEILLPEALDLVLVPCTAFDADCFRVGMGKGYYDRFLRSFAGRSVGLCYANCIKDRLPSGPWDVPVQRVVTERGVVGGSETGCVGARAIHSQIWEDTR